MRHRLLAIDVLAHLDRPEGRGSVNMIRRADGDGVDVLLFLLQQDAEIFVTSRVGKLLVSSRRPAVVDVAQGDDVGPVGGVLANVAASHSAGPDPGHVHPFAGREVAASSQNVTGHNRGRHRRGESAAEKLAAGGLGASGMVLTERLHEGLL
jgi:hypothetical protein